MDTRVLIIEYFPIVVLPLVLKWWISSSWLLIIICPGAAWGRGALGWWDRGGPLNLPLTEAFILKCSRGLWVQRTVRCVRACIYVRQSGKRENSFLHEQFCCFCEHHDLTVFAIFEMFPLRIFQFSNIRMDETKVNANPTHSKRSDLCLNHRTKESLTERNCRILFVYRPSKNKKKDASRLNEMGDSWLNDSLPPKYVRSPPETFRATQATV